MIWTAQAIRSATARRPLEVTAQMWPQWLEEQGQIRQAMGNNKKTEKFNNNRCVTRYALKQYPAYGKVWTKGKVKNRFAKQCFSKGNQSSALTVKLLSVTHSLWAWNTELLSVNHIEQDMWMVPLQVNGAVIQPKLDTGAKANLICEQDIWAMKIKLGIYPNSVCSKPTMDSTLTPKAHAGSKWGSKKRNATSCL